MARRGLPPMTGLRAFEAFARAGSMTLAAEDLLVTHGAVSRPVRGLEAHLGVALVSGPRHQLRLTDAGRELAAGLSSAFDLIAGALPGAGPTRELVVSCLGTLAMKWLIPRLSGFLDGHPGWRVRIVEDHGPVDFSQGGIHAAIRINHGERGPYRTTAFMEHFHGPVLAPALLAEIDGHPARVLTLPRLYSETFRPAWSEWASRAGVALPPSPLDREFEHNSYMLEASAAGLGVAVAPWAFCCDDIERGRLVAPFGFESFGLEPGSSRYVYLRPRLGDNPLAAAFGDWLKKEGAASPAPPAAIKPS
jgi:LysR family glycine cleavage system transcriptional activator